MLNNKYRYLILLGGLFFLPRLACFFWVTHYSSAYQEQTFGRREPSPTADGTWVVIAQKLSARDPHLYTSDDIGYPLVMSWIKKGGLSLKSAFYVTSFILLAIAFWFLVLLFRFLLRSYDKRLVWVSMAFLSLYPPGIYGGFFGVSRILPVYSFLVAVVVLLHARSWFATFSFKTFLIWLNLSLLIAFLSLARNTNKAIFAALFIGLLFSFVADRYTIKPLLFCAAIVFGLIYISKTVFPPFEHSKWHPIYLGLSDFDNKYNIQPKDGFAFQAARNANPILRDVGNDIDHHSEYESTLKKITLDLIKNDPLWYSGLIIKRFIKVTVLPYQGSWMMIVGDSKLNTKVKLGDLYDGLGWDRLYIFGDILTAFLDAFLTFMGFVVLVKKFVKGPVRQSVPMLFLLLATIQIYALVMVSNRTIFLAGTYFYQFFAVIAVSQKIFELADAYSYKTGARSGS